MLSRHGLAKLKAMSFAPSAVRWMEDHAVTQSQAQASLLDNATLPFIRHVNNTPPGFRLVVEAARPVDPDIYKADTRHFEKHRSKYLRFLGSLARRSPAHFESVNLRHHPKGGPSEGRESTVLRIGQSQIAQLEKGITPDGWSVEHIKARAYDYERSKNSFRNLILMPTSYNDWTARLEALQHAVLFKQDEENPRRLIVMAEPVRSAPQGHFVYGARCPVNIAQKEIAALLDREIGSLSQPAVTEPASGPPLPLGHPPKRKTLTLSSRRP